VGAQAVGSQGARGKRSEHLRFAYEQLLEVGEKTNPPAQRVLASSTGNRGKVKQSEATNRLKRLREHADDVWRFMTEPDVPFTNNGAEQAVRMPKVGRA
jgi:transposase